MTHPASSPRAKKRIILAVLAIKAVVVVLILTWSRKAPEPQAAESHAPSDVATRRETRNSLDVVREDRDRTIWAKELFAQRLEMRLVKLWDSLRATNDATLPLGDFAFDELQLAEPGEFHPYEHDITLRRLDGRRFTVKTAEWQALLVKYKAAGYQLNHSEWRHARCSVPASGPAESIVFIALELRNAEQRDRMIIRGNLSIRWRSGSDPETVHIERIDATGLELLSRRSPPEFDYVLAADLGPDRVVTELPEPSLHLYDLDGDGLSEILLPTVNRLLWNRGEGIFAADELCTVAPTEFKTGVLGDFDGDARSDFLVADPHGLAFYGGDEQGRFTRAPVRSDFTREILPNPMALTCGDVDGDNDLDVWLAQYKVPYRDGQFPEPYYDANDGYPSYFLLNDGAGNFRDATAEAGLEKKRFRRTYSSSFADTDDDGDLDLVVVSDFAGIDVYANDGRGHFVDCSARAINEPHGFGMAHSFADYNGDGRLDLLMIGMNSYAADRLESFGAGPAEFPEYNRMRSRMAYGNRLYYGTGKGVFAQSTLSDGVARSGWSWGVTSGDFDNDGDLDIYIANGHITRKSAADYDSEFWRHDIYLGRSRESPVLDRHFRDVQERFLKFGYSYGGYERNKFYLNCTNSFLEVAYLMGLALDEDSRNTVSDDLDGDGKPELLVTSFTTFPELRQALHLFPNFWFNAGNWIGVRLRESGDGFSPVGAKVYLTTSNGRMVRQLVTGDSYRSQHSPTAHFGLGSTQAEKLEVVWPNHRTNTLLRPAMNRYHVVAPDRDR